MLRERKFNAQNTVGEPIRFLDNENGFVIDPLLEAKPITTPKIHLRPLKKNTSSQKKRLNMDLKTSLKAKYPLNDSRNESPDPLLKADQFKEWSATIDDQTSLEGKTLDAEFQTKTDKVDTQNSSKGFTTGRDFGN